MTQCLINFNFSKKSTITATSTTIVAAHPQRVALSKCLILNPYYVGNQGNHDIKLQVTMLAMFRVNDVLSMYYKCDFDLSEDESNCVEGEEIQVYRGPRVAALSRAVTLLNL